MFKSKLLASLLALILTVSAIGTVNVTHIANAASDGDVEAQNRNLNDSHDEKDSAEDDDSEDKNPHSMDNNHDEENNHQENRESRHQEPETKIEIEDDGLEIEVEMEDMDLQDGLYNVTLSCEQPPISMNFTNAFRVENGKGEFESDINLANGSYSGCMVNIQDTNTSLATIGSFTIVGEPDEETGQGREERRKNVVNNHDAQEIHERHLKANPSSPGEYEPGMEYVLTSTGIAEFDENDDALVKNVAVNMTIATWKSNSALVMFDVLDGTAAIGNKTYTIQLGYALYSINGHIVSIKALATDDETSAVVKLSLRGDAVDGALELPKDSGATIDFTFDGNDGMFRNQIGDWELMLEGTVKAA